MPPLLYQTPKERVDAFLMAIQKSYDAKEFYLVPRIFKSFDFLSFKFSVDEVRREDEVKRLFNGNGINQSGLFNFA
jgi:hypothetical protein